LFLFFIDNFSFAKTVIIKGTYIRVQSGDELVSKDLFCGAGNYPNDMTKNLISLFEQALKELTILPDGNLGFSHPIKLTHRNLVFIHYRRIYDLSHNPEYILEIAKEIISLKKAKEEDKIETLFPYFKRKLDYPIYPGFKKPFFAVGEEKTYEFTGCYTIKDLNQIADSQIRIAEEFIKLFNKKVESLKEIRKKMD
jgi:hypothetical protein